MIIKRNHRSFRLQQFTDSQFAAAPAAALRMQAHAPRNDTNPHVVHRMLDIGLAR